MWLYLGPSCPDRPSSEELSATEINTRIYKAMDLGANPNLGAGLAPLQEGVASTRVSMLRHVLVAHAIQSFHRAHGLMQGLEGACSEPWDANMPEAALRWKVNQAPNEKMQAIEYGSSSEEGEEVEITLPPLSSLRITPPPLGDIISR
jgi:hypothetical protein